MEMEAHKDSPSSQTILDAETHALVEALFQVVRAGDTARIAGLLSMGLVPNLRDSKGDSLLMLSSYHGHGDTAELLLKHGADPELANDRCQTPLAGAAFKGDVAMARLLLNHGADVNGRVPGGKTALMYAAMFDREDMVDLLMQHGADPTLTTRDGQTAMTLAEVMGAEGTWAKLAFVDSANDSPARVTGSH